MLELINNNVWIHFVKNPTDKIHIRALSRKLKLSAPTILQQSRPLLKDGLLKSRKEGKNLILYSNYENEKFIENKKWSNLFILLDSGLTEEIVTDTIILFGSFSRGEDTEKSDIDIAVNDDIKVDKIEKYESILNRKIQFHNLRLNINENLKDNIRQGILIKGVMI